MDDLAGAPMGQSRSVRLLRVVQHVLFTSMVVLGLVRSAFDDGATTSELVIAVVLLGWYWMGPLAPLRWSRPPAQLWLAVLSTACLLSVWISADFAWVSFAVFVTYATTLGPRVAVAAIVALAAGTGAILVIRWPSEGHWAAQVVGPLVGAAAAGALVGVGRLAAAEAAERQRLVEELLATRDDLAFAHLEAGARGERERLTARSTTPSRKASHRWCSPRGERVTPPVPATRPRPRRRSITSKPSGTAASTQPAAS